MLNTPIKSLDGNTPKDAFITVYGEDLYIYRLRIHLLSSLFSFISIKTALNLKKKKVRKKTNFSLKIYDS